MRVRWLLATALTVIAPQTATAADVTAAACASVDLAWTFEPPLTRAVSSGTATIVGNNVCAIATVSDDPPGESVTVPGAQLTATGNYLGDCTIAVVSVNGVAFLLLGGTVLVGLNDDLSFAGPILLVPDQLCNERTATSAGAGVALLTNTGP